MPQARPGSASPQGGADPRPDAVRVELDRIDRRWAHLPLPAAQAGMPTLRRALEALTAAAGQDRVPDLGPATAMHQLKVLVWEACRADRRLGAADAPAAVHGPAATSEPGGVDWPSAGSEPGGVDRSSAVHGPAAAVGPGGVDRSSKGSEPGAGSEPGGVDWSSAGGNPGRAGIPDLAGFLADLRRSLP